MQDAFWMIVDGSDFVELRCRCYKQGGRRAEVFEERRVVMMKRMKEKDAIVRSEFRRFAAR